MPETCPPHPKLSPCPHSTPQAPVTHPPSTLKGAKSVARSHTRPSRPRKHEKTCKKEAVGGGDCHQPAVGTIKTCPHVSHVPVPAHQPAHTPQPRPRRSNRGASTHACVTIEFGVCRTVPSAGVGSADSVAQVRSFTAVPVGGGDDCGCGVLRPELLEQLLEPKKSETEIMVARPAPASSTAPTARA